MRHGGIILSRNFPASVSATRSACYRFGRMPLRLNDSLFLTPREVAELLKISVNTVYRHRPCFGPSYPGGLKCLRFREDLGRAAGESRVGMALADAGAGEKVFRPCQDQGGGPGRHGKEAGRVDPELVARAPRMGLLKSGDGLPLAKPKESSRLRPGNTSCRTTGLFWNSRGICPVPDQPAPDRIVPPDPEKQLQL